MNQFMTSTNLNRRKSRIVLGLTVSGLALLAIAAAAANPALKLSDNSLAFADAQKVGQAFTQVTKSAAPAVVYIQVEKSVSASPKMQFDQNHPFNDELLKKFFGDRLPKFEMPKFDAPKQPWNSMGQGSGFIISKDGYVLTNAHVVGGANRVTVTLSDGTEYEAKIVGTDRSTDVAVIKIDGKNLPMLQMGNSDDLEVGEWVLAVGSPFGLPGTVTSGIVSAKGRSRVGIADYENFIQTDAAINPGNSGGPLLNLKGEAVGINTAIFSRSGGYMGIGFAIPINMVRNICDQLIEDGSVTRGYMGIGIQKLTPALAKSFGLDQTDGVLISNVSKDSPAETAGLKSGDVIVEFDGHKVKDLGSLRNRVASTSPQSEVNIGVYRDGKLHEFTLTVGTLESKQITVALDAAGSGSLGFSVGPLTDDQKERHGDKDDGGVVITHVESGSVAAKSGLQPGMLVMEVNRKAIDSVETFKKIIEDRADSDHVLLLVKKGEQARYIALKWNDK